MKKVRLADLAYARSGDKGGHANVGVIAYTEKAYDLLEKILDEKRVAKHFEHLGINKVKRYLLPNLWAMNFLLEGALGKGGSLSLRTDAQGKALGQALLLLPIELEEGF